MFKIVVLLKTIILLLIQLTNFVVGVIIKSHLFMLKNNFVFKDSRLGCMGFQRVITLNVSPKYPAIITLAHAPNFIYLK